MFNHRNLVQVASQIQKVLEGKYNDCNRVVIVAYDRISDSLRIDFLEDFNKVNSSFEEELILVCYYAPKGNWKKWYGDEWFWELSAKRIALDIKNNTLLYQRHYAVNGMEDLPIWLKTEVEKYL